MGLSSTGAVQKFKLGVPIRDMRLLDPHLASSETGRLLVSLQPGLRTKI